jgi:hypothetical protein
VSATWNVSQAMSDLLTASDLRHTGVAVLPPGHVVEAGWFTVERDDGLTVRVDGLAAADEAAAESLIAAFDLSPRRPHGPVALQAVVNALSAPDRAVMDAAAVGYPLLQDPDWGPDNGVEVSGYFYESPAAAWFTFDQASGDALDGSAYINHATLEGDAAYVEDAPDFTSGPVNPRYGLVVGGAGHASASAHAAYELGSGAFTLGGFVRFASAGGVQTFAGSSQGAGAGVPKWVFGYGLDASGQLSFHYNGTGLGAGVYLFNEAWSPALGQWYLLTVTRSGSAWKLYIDGVEEDADADAVTLPYPAAPLTFGWAEGAQYLDGRLYDWRLFRGAALTAAQALSWREVGDPFHEF